MQVFSNHDLVTIVGIDTQVARDWYLKGVFKASVPRRVETSGCLLCFSFVDVFCAWLTRDLRKHGISISVCKKATQLIYKSTWDNWPEAPPVLVIQPGVVKIMSRADARKLSGGPKLVTTIDLLTNVEFLQREIDSQLEADEPEPIRAKRQTPRFALQTIPNTKRPQPITNTITTPRRQV